MDVVDKRVKVTLASVNVFATELEPVRLVPDREGLLENMDDLTIVSVCVRDATNGASVALGVITEPNNKFIIVHKELASTNSKQRKFVLAHSIRGEESL